MKKEMLINVLQPEECRIAIVEDGVLEELYVERSSQESYVGNIYKGRIVNIEPSIQAAFVDFGIGRNGFLHVSDVDPAYYRHPPTRDRRGRRRGEPKDVAAGTEPAETTGPEETAAREPEDARDDDRPPRLESAERRTEEDEPSYAGALDPSGGGADDIHHHEHDFDRQESE